MGVGNNCKAEDGGSGPERVSIEGWPTIGSRGRERSLLDPSSIPIYLTHLPTHTPSTHYIQGTQAHPSPLVSPNRALCLTPTGMNDRVQSRSRSLDLTMVTGIRLRTADRNSIQFNSTQYPAQSINQSTCRVISYIHTSLSSKLNSLVKPSDHSINPFSCDLRVPRHLSITQI